MLAIAFMPTVEALEEGAIIPEQPIVMVKDALKLPTITGLVAKEGMFAFYIGTSIAAFSSNISAIIFVTT